MLLLSMCLVLLVSLLILFIIWIHTAPLEQHGGEEAIVILGYRCDNNEIHPLLLDRLNTALTLIHLNSYRSIIVSGGNVSQASSITEAEIMKDYLIQNGIHRDKVLMEKESRDTIENLVNCKRIMERENIRSFLMISNSFHIRRITMIAQALGLEPAFYASRNIWSITRQFTRTLNEMKLFMFTYRKLKKHAWH